MCVDIYDNHTCSTDASARYAQAALNILSFVMIVFGNGLTICVILTDRQLHNVSFLVLLNLAVSDFLLGVVSQPPSIYYAFTCVWPSGSDGFLCQFVGFFICLLCSVSILSLAFVSYERYVYIVYPFEYPTKIKLGRGIFICAMLWAYSMLASVFPVSGLWEGVGLLPDTALCMVLWHSQLMYMLAMILLVLLPAALVIMYSYYQILRKARAMSKLEARHRQAVELNPVTPSKNGSNGSSGGQATPDGTSSPDSQSLNGVIMPATPTTLRKVSMGNARKVARVFVKERKSTITITVLIGTFLACWTPYVTVHIIQAIRCRPMAFWESAFTQWLCIFNSACNPIVYGITNAAFRDAVKRFLRRCGFCKKVYRNARTTPCHTPIRRGGRGRYEETVRTSGRRQEVDRLA